MRRGGLLLWLLLWLLLVSCVAEEVEVGVVPSCSHEEEGQECLLSDESAVDIKREQIDETKSSEGEEEKEEPLEEVEDDEEDSVAAELDELIRLQQMKLEHLMKSRGKKNKKSASQSSSTSSPGGTAVNSAATAPPPQQHRRAFSTLQPLEKYLVPRHSFKTTYPIAAHHIMRVRAVMSEGAHKSSPRDVLLVLLLDKDGHLHVLDENGSELLQKNMNHFHRKEIVVSEVESHTDMGPIFVTAAKDGSVNVLSLMVETSGSDISVMVAEVSNFNIRVKQKKGKHSSNIELPHPTSMHLYNRGSQRGMAIYIGDSYCRFSIYMLNSTLVGRAAVSAHPVSSDHTASGLYDADDYYECGPGEQLGLGHMSRIGQVMAIPVGKAIMLLHIARLYLPPRVCHGSNEQILEAGFDLRSMTYLFASTASGDLLTFNTKSKDEKGKETRCILSRRVSGQEASGKRANKRLHSLMGYFLEVQTNDTIAGGCGLSIFNTTSIKQNKEGLLLSSDVLVDQCGGDLSLSASPKNLMDRSTRILPDVLLSIAHNSEVDEEKDFGSGGEVHVFLSLLVPIEVEDELAWLQVPMMVGGVAIFILFKLFGAKKNPKPNTSGGTYSKYGKYHNRFSDRSGGNTNADELKRLQKKLSEIENSVGSIDTAGSELLKKYS